MDTIYILTAAILLILGFIGCVLPVLPGPALAYGALLMMMMSSFAPSGTACVVFGIVCAAVLLLDYVVPAMGAKKFNCSKWGVAGCLIGTIAGMFFGPWGIVLGPFVGAVFGEAVAGKKPVEAVKGGFGAFLGFVFGVMLKLVYCAVCAGWILLEIFR
jgi:uncharacterized protein YqgC (DUF456 family)